MLETRHELIRTLEVFDILTVAQLIMNACLSRKSSSRMLSFNRADYPEMDPIPDHKFITVKQKNGRIEVGEHKLDYYGGLAENYERFNKDYIGGRK